MGARLSPDCFAGLLFNASGRWTMQEEEPVRSRYVQGGGGGTELQMIWGSFLCVPCQDERQDCGCETLSL